MKNNERKTNNLTNKYPSHIKIEDFREVSKKELAKFLDHTIGKKNWRVGAETDDIYAYRMNSANSNSIVALCVYEKNVSKEKCVKMYIKDIFFDNDKNKIKS